MAEAQVERGGRRQRQQRNQYPENTSALASRLLQQWGWGKLSAPQVQKIAALAALDVETARNTGRGLPGLERLARIGGERAEVANMGRDLMQTLPRSQLH